MIYYCIYKDECKNRTCSLKSRKERLSTFSKSDMCTVDFPCSRIDVSGVLLTSSERLMCEKRLKCQSKTCILRNSYLTIKNVGPINTIVCELTGKIVNIITDGDTSKYISIWE